MATCMRVCTLLFVALCCTGVLGYTYIMSCPEEKEPYETFIPPYLCENCSCTADGQWADCVGCGAVSIPLTDPDKCYATFYQRTTDFKYPDCCAVKELCEGDPDFDPTVNKTSYPAFKNMTDPL